MRAELIAPLVERLRNPWHHADCRAAADEIERLRAALAQANSAAEQSAALRTVAGQVLRDMQAQGLLIEWQTMLEEVLQPNVKLT